MKGPPGGVPEGCNADSNYFRVLTCSATAFASSAESVIAFLWGAFLLSSPFVSRSVIWSALRLMPFTAGPILPWPSGPWQAVHFAL